MEITRELQDVLGCLNATQKMSTPQAKAMRGLLKELTLAGHGQQARELAVACELHVRTEVEKSAFSAAISSAVKTTTRVSSGRPDLKGLSGRGPQRKTIEKSPAEVRAEKLGEAFAAVKEILGVPLGAPELPHS